MARASVTVRVEPESVLADRSFVNSHGEPRAWLYVGDSGDLAICGRPDGLLRLAAGLIATPIGLSDSLTRSAIRSPERLGRLGGGWRRRDGDR